MASLRKRANRYYIVFTRRTDCNLEQRVASLQTDCRRRAERTKFELEEKVNTGLIDPFGAWDIRREFEGERRRSRCGMSLASVGKAFLESRSHVSPATLSNYERRFDRLATAIGPTMPVRLIEPRDIRSFCFKPHFSNATKRTYFRFCRMLLTWMEREGYVDESVAAGIATRRRRTISRLRR